MPSNRQQLDAAVRGHRVLTQKQVETLAELTGALSRCREDTRSYVAAFDEYVRGLIRAELNSKGR
jgi:hypothetical protein